MLAPNSKSEAELSCAAWRAACVPRPPCSATPSTPCAGAAAAACPFPPLPACSEHPPDTLLNFPAAVPSLCLDPGDAASAGTGDTAAQATARPSCWFACWCSDPAVLVVGSSPLQEWRRTAQMNPSLAQQSFPLTPHYSVQQQAYPRCCCCHFAEQVMMTHPYYSPLLHCYRHCSPAGLPVHPHRRPAPHAPALPHQCY